MSEEHANQTKLLREASFEHSLQFGLDLCESVELAAKPILDWLTYLRAFQKTGTADVFLDGVQSAIIETAGCLSLGLLRSALFSIRAQIDMLLAWLFFKDHPVEWDFVQATGKGFKLKQDIIEYLSIHIPEFKTRFGLLRQKKIRKEDDPYKLLSAHIHSQSAICIPSIFSLKEITQPHHNCIECVEIQREVSEYLNDILFSSYADRWASLPETIVTDTMGRLSQAQKKIFFTK
jgi:hypothetical protein